MNKLKFDRLSSMYLLVFFIGIFVSSGFWIFAILNIPVVETTKVKYIYSGSNIDLESLAEAISWEESKCKTNAIGDGGKAIGNLQIWKIYVDEVNRLEGYRKYKYEDRYDKEKSISMFIDMNKHKNPNGYLHLAIKIHNPQASLSYHRRIEDKYNELVKLKSK